MVLAHVQFKFEDFLLTGEIGPVRLGVDKLQVENVLGKFDFYEKTIIGWLATYNNSKPNFQFYFDNKNYLYNFHLSHNIAVENSNSTILLIQKLFLGYEPSYLEQRHILNTVLKNNIRVYFINDLSNDLAGYSYVTEKNVNLIFRGGILSYIGTSVNSITNVLNSYKSVIEIDKGSLFL